jgi:hypothetical protein
MSVRVMSWVWESSLSEGIDRLVLLAIADCANDAGSHAWPSRASLARKCHIGDKTVRRAVLALVSLGELQVTENAGRNGANLYRVVMNRPGSQDDPQGQSDPGQVDPPGVRESVRGVNESRQGGQSDTRTVLEPSGTINKNNSMSEVAARRSDVEAICGHLADRIEANGSKRPAVTQRWRESARRLLDLDGRTEQQVHSAIDWCQGDEFWRSNILSMPKLREKYDQLRLAAARGQPNGHKPSTTDQRVADALALADRLQRKALA